VIWAVGAQKVVPDLSTALRRIENHCHPGRGTVLLLREAIGF
jgi:hypothetical protein